MQKFQRAAILFPIPALRVPGSGVPPAKLPALIGCLTAVRDNAPTTKPLPLVTDQCCRIAIL